MTGGYTHEDVMQAVVAALEFGALGIGEDALATWQEAVSTPGGHLESVRPGGGGIVDRFGAVLWLGGGKVVHVSGEALALLAQAETQHSTRCIAIRGDHSAHYDLRMEEPARMPYSKPRILAPEEVAS